MYYIAVTYLGMKQYQTLTVFSAHQQYMK